MLKTLLKKHQPQFAPSRVVHVEKKDIFQKIARRRGDEYLGKFPTIEVDYDQQEIEDWGNI